MHGSLALAGGVLWVARWARTLSVRPYDLDGRRLAGGFDFRDAEVGASDASGLAVDDDRRLWVADRRGGVVRAFTVFGAASHRLGVLPGAPAPDDAPGAIAEPVGIAAEGSADRLRLFVANGGERRHALQVFDERGLLVRSLASEGDPHRRFRGLEGVALRGFTTRPDSWPPPFRNTSSAPAAAASATAASQTTAVFITASSVRLQPERPEGRALARQ